MQVFAKATVMLTLATMLGGCATGPRIYSSLQPQVVMSGYETYSYAPMLGTDTPGQPTTLLTQYLRSAIDREMRARGYRYLPDGGDLLVNFYVETQEKIQSRSAPGSARIGIGFGYYSYRRGLYTAWDTYPEAAISQYTEGTLNIDVADAARRELIWEGIAIGRITEETRRNVQATVDAVVPLVFAEFPGGTVVR